MFSSRECWRSGGVALLGWSGKASLSRRIREGGGGGGITPPIMHYTCRHRCPESFASLTSFTLVAETSYVPLKAGSSPEQELYFPGFLWLGVTMRLRFGQSHVTGQRALQQHPVCLGGAES